MKTSYTCWFVVIAVTLAGVSATSRTPAPAPVNAPASATASPAAASPLWNSDPVLLKLTAFYRNTTDFSASFQQIVTTRSPKRTFRRGGKVFFKRPGLMRWDYSDPDVVHYVSNGNYLWAYDAEDASAVKMNVADSDLYSALGFLSGTSSLSGSFIPEVSPGQMEGQFRVKLVPVTANGGYRYVVLTVSGQTGEVVETEVVDPVGNVSKIRFESPKYVPIPVSAFDFEVPAGVTVQDLTGAGTSGH